MLSLSLGAAPERSVWGPGKEYDEQGLGMPACWQRLGAAWSGPPLLPGHWEGRARVPGLTLQGLLSHPGGLGPPQSSRRGREDWLSHPTPSLTEERKAGRGGGDQWKEDRVKGLGAEGGQLGAKGREGGLILGFESQKNEKLGLGWEEAPTSGGKHSELLLCPGPSSSLGVPVQSRNQPDHQCLASGDIGHGVSTWTRSPGSL